MNPQDLIIDTASFGKQFWLVGVTPVRAYENGKRTDNVIGYRYDTVLPDKHMEKVGIKIEGKQLLDAPLEGYAEVRYEGLELFLYWRNGTYEVGARAKGISLVKA